MDFHTKMISFITILVCGLCIAPSKSIASEKMKTFEDSGLVPNYFNYPEQIAEITYGQIQIDPGTTLMTRQTQETPTVKWQAMEDKWYTLLMFDPDIPPEVPAPEIVHWLLVNIPGNDIARGVLLMDYIGACPPDANLHRYPIIIYEQTDQFHPQFYNDFTDDKLGRNSLRMATRQKDLVSKLNLGRVVAANFFLSKTDADAAQFLKEVYEKYPSN